MELSLKFKDKFQKSEKKKREYISSRKIKWNKDRKKSLSPLISGLTGLGGFQKKEGIKQKDNVTGHNTWLQMLTSQLVPMGI